MINNSDPLTIHNIKVETLPDLNSSLEKPTTAATSNVQTSEPSDSNIIVTTELSEPSLESITVQSLVQGPIVQPQVAVQAEQLTLSSTLPTETNPISSIVVIEPSTIQPVSLPSITVQPISGDFIEPQANAENIDANTGSIGLDAIENEDVPAKKPRIEESTDEDQSKKINTETTESAHTASNSQSEPVNAESNKSVALESDSKATSNQATEVAQALQEETKSTVQES